MGHCYLQASLIGEAPPFALSEPHLGPVAAAAVRRDGKTLGVRVAQLAELAPPASDTFNGECPSIGIDADADPAKVGGNVVDPVWRVTKYVML